MTEITSEANISQGERVPEKPRPFVDHPVETVQNPELANLVRSSIDGGGILEETAPTREEPVSTRNDLASHESTGAKPRHWFSRLTNLGRFVRSGNGEASPPAKQNKIEQVEPTSFRSPDAVEKIRQGGWEDRARANLAALYRELIEEKSSPAHDDNIDIVSFNARPKEIITYDPDDIPLLEDAYAEYGVRGALLSLHEYQGESTDEVYGIFVPAKDVRAQGAHHKPEDSILVNIAGRDNRTGKFVLTKGGELRAGTRLTFGPPDKENDFSSVAKINEEGKLEITVGTNPVAVLSRQRADNSMLVSV